MTFWWLWLGWLRRSLETNPYFGLLDIRLFIFLLFLDKELEHLLSFPEISSLRFQSSLATMWGYIFRKVKVPPILRMKNVIRIVRRKRNLAEPSQHIGRKRLPTLAMGEQRSRRPRTFGKGIILDTTQEMKLGFCKSKSFSNRITWPKSIFSKIDWLKNKKTRPFSFRNHGWPKGNSTSHFHQEWVWYEIR